MNGLKLLTLVAALGLLALLAGCGGGEQQEAAKADQAEQMETEAQHAVQEAMTEAAAHAETAEEAIEEVVSKLTPEQQAVVDKCVEISRAVMAAPLQAEKIMTDHGMTSEEYDKMMQKISDDPAMSLAYTTAMAKQ